MDGEEFRELLSTYTVLPQKMLHIFQNLIKNYNVLKN